MGILTLLTDFGTEDYYVAAVKGTVLSRAPGTEIVDVSHQVPPGDVETAAFLLAAAAPAFPAGTVHLAVVDPGVGSGRR
ncbi:MAG TPA: SAM-dependent chlorinase/fluorinase, partial [Thermoanaerobaculia bacterium]|nr:SAM-dependent chlorinase/fluorinase [Thermoanaerobaculia bacterium]